jgi:transcriptional regulator with XRE-family HTH domain
MYRITELRHIIKDIRQKNGLSQKEFCKICKLGSFQNVSNFERGINPITFKTLERIEKGMNVEIRIIVV